LGRGTRRDENPGLASLALGAPMLDEVPVGAAVSPEPGIPSCFHCCRSASVEKPLRTASSGVHITPDIAAAKSGSYENHTGVTEK
jgi:hypothetical protein